MPLKSISSTKIYQYYDKSAKLTDKLIAIIPTSKTLSSDDLIVPLNIIKKNFAFTGKQDILNAFNVGNIILKYSDLKTKIPDAIPCILSKGPNSSMIGIANLSNQITKTKTGDVNIDPRKLYLYMSTTYMNLLIYKHFGTLSVNSQIVTDTCFLYAHLFTKVINKMCNINVDKVKYEEVLYLTARFCANSLFQRDEGNLALERICKNNSPEFIKRLTISFPEAAFTNIESFIQSLTENIKGLEILTLRSFLENYISMYGPSTILGIENLIYFYHMIFAILIGCHINNQYNIENVVDNKVETLYNKLISYTL